MSSFTKEMFEALSNEMGSQKMLEIESSVRVYYGMSNEGNPRLSFMSSVAPPKMDSTKMLKVIQGKKWTAFTGRVLTYSSRTQSRYFTHFAVILSVLLKESAKKRKRSSILKTDSIFGSPCSKGAAQVFPQNCSKGCLESFTFSTHSSLTSMVRMKQSQGGAVPTAQPRIFQSEQIGMK